MEQGYYRSYNYEFSKFVLNDYFCYPSTNTYLNHVLFLQRVKKSIAKSKPSEFIFYSSLLEVVAADTDIPPFPNSVF